MTVEHALGVPIFTDFQNAFQCIRSHGPDSCCIMGVKGKVADRLSQANLPFHALEFVRSDHRIWAHECNAASLPLGCLSSTTWIRRLQSVSIIPPIDAGSPWTWKGRTMSKSVLVRFYVAEEGNDAGFAVRSQDVHLTSQSLVGHEDLGELLPASASLETRTELVLETTVDDARRVRQIPDVHHISQRKVGQKGRVRITVDMPESIIPEATSHSLVSFLSVCQYWFALLSIRGAMGGVVFSAHKETWISGRVLCESPRWVLVDTSTGLHSDDVISRLKEWHVNKEGRINLSVGLIDSGAKAEIRNVDPRFTTGTCKALLSAVGIWVDSKSISID